MSVIQPDVTIVIVSYNTREMTLECLRSVERETATPHELLVIDNASDDGSAEAIAAEFPELALHRSDTNHGFARANNLLVADATADLVLLLNPDTVVLDAAIDRLIEHARLVPDARIWGGRTVFADGTLNPASCWRRMNVGTILCRVLGLDRRFSSSPVLNAEAYGGWERDSQRRVDIVSGCFFLIQRSLWNELGGFDLAYVMYGEEADLCLRARALGANPSITPTAQIVHYGGASERVRSAKLVRLLRAKITLVQRHFAPVQRLIGLNLLRSWPALRLVASTTLAKLAPSDSRRETRDVWAAIWADRRTWWNGYPRVSK